MVLTLQFGCDDIAMGALIRPGLTSVQVPMYEIGARAMELVLQTLEAGESVRSEPILLDCQLLVRDSACGAGSRTGQLSI